MLWLRFRFEVSTRAVPLAAALLLAVLGAGCASDDGGKTPGDSQPVEEGGTTDQSVVDAGADAADDGLLADSALPPDAAPDTAPAGPWQRQANPANIQLNDVWGRGPNDIFAVGKGGVILHWDGKLWEMMNNPKTEDLYAVFAVSKDNVFAVGEGIAVQYTLEKCKSSTPDAGTDDGGLDAGGPVDPCPPGQYCDNDGYCQPGTWKEAFSSSYDGSLRGVWGTAADNLYAVGLEGVIRHRTSSTSTYWTSVSGVPTDEDLYDIIGFSENEIYAVGAKGAIVAYDGAAWKAMSSGVSSDLQAIWGSSGKDLFAVGLDGVIVHYDGNAWTKMSANTQSYFYGVWGSSSKDVWVVGHSVFKQGEAVFRYDGSKWTNMAPPFDPGVLNGVFVSGANDVHAVGNFSLLHYSK